MRPEILITGLAITGIALAAPGGLQKKEAEALAEQIQPFERAAIPEIASQPHELSKKEVGAKPRRKRQAKREPDAIPCQIL